MFPFILSVFIFSSLVFVSEYYFLNKFSVAEEDSAVDENEESNDEIQSEEAEVILSDKSTKKRVNVRVLFFTLLFTQAFLALSLFLAYKVVENKEVTREILGMPYLPEYTIVDIEKKFGPDIKEWEYDDSYKEIDRVNSNKEMHSKVIDLLNSNLFKASGYDLTIESNDLSPSGSFIIKFKIGLSALLQDTDMVMTVDYDGDVATVSVGFTGELSFIPALTIFERQLEGNYGDLPNFISEKLEALNKLEELSKDVAVYSVGKFIRSVLEN